MDRDVNVIGGLSCKLVSDYDVQEPSLIWDTELDSFAELHHHVSSHGWNEIGVQDYDSLAYVLQLFGSCLLRFLCLLQGHRPLPSEPLVDLGLGQLRQHSYSLYRENRTFAVRFYYLRGTKPHK